MESGSYRHWTFPGHSGAESDAKRTVNMTQAGQQDDEVGQLVRKGGWASHLNAGSHQRGFSDASGEIVGAQSAEVLRLKHDLGLSYRRIGEATGVGKTQASLTGVFSPSPAIASTWVAFQTELKRRGVTLALLWQEYLAEHPTGYSYKRFCELHRAWR